MSVDPDRSIEKFLKTLLSLSMKSLREYLVNTPSANPVEEKIEKTAISIRSVVTNYAKALRFLQGLDDGTKPPFTIREWMTQERYDNSWLFISTQARHRKSVRPLISLWVSLATLLLQSMGKTVSAACGSFLMKPRAFSASRSWLKRWRKHVNSADVSCWECRTWRNWFTSTAASWQKHL